MTSRRVLAVAAATGRVAYVYFIDGKPALWGISEKAANSPLLAAHQTAKWLAAYTPDVVVIEEIRPNSRKGELTKYLLAAIADTAHERKCEVMTVPRVQRFKNKYEEAEALAALFPSLRAWLPERPRIWEAEPRNILIFEAIALAGSVSA